MGNTESIPPNYGFQVIEILDRSPGAKSGLILETDFVLTVNGKKLRKMTPETIKALVQVLMTYNHVIIYARLNYFYDLDRRMKIRRYC